MVTSMPDEKLPAVPKRYTSIVLTVSQRLGAVAAGLVLGAVGGLAELWARLDGIGTVSFVVAGTASVLLGVVGRMPSRLSGKDYTMEFVEQEKDRAVEAAVENVVEDLSTSAKKEIAKKAELDEQDTIPVSTFGGMTRKNRQRSAKGMVAIDAAIRSLDFEEYAIAKLSPILIRMGYTVKTTNGAENYQDADYVATGPQGQVFIFLRRWTGDMLPIIDEKVKAKRLIAHNSEDRAILMLDRADIVRGDYEYDLSDSRIAVLSSTYSNDLLARELTAFLQDGRIDKL